MELMELFVRYIQPYLPDVVVRLILRLVLSHAVRQLGSLRWPQRELRLVDKIRQLAQTDIAYETAAANEQHYEVPTAFFTQSLGPRLKYSSCEWPSSSAATLADAEEYTLDKYLSLLKVEKGDRVLDIGCGWGSFSLYAAARFPECTIVCFSNSATQIAHIAAQAQSRGLTNLTAIKLDINQLSRDALVERGVSAEPFDRIFACESLEHSRNYAELFRRIASLLSPAGRAFFQILGHREYSYLMNRNSWMGRRFFSGGTIPSMQLFHHFNEHLLVERAEAVSGEQYARTLDAWLRLMYARHAECVRALADGEGEAVGRRRLEEWRMFYLMCSASFGLRGGREWMVGYYVLRRRDCAAP
jgi:cyclopropane-fatty-acyl-phospholipid synthase